MGKIASMKRVKTAAAMCLLVAGSGAVHAQQQKPDEGRSRLIFPPGAKEPLATPAPRPPGSPAAPTASPAKIIESFFAALQDGKVESAYENLVRGSMVAERKEDVTALIARTKEALDAYGPINGYEVIEDRAVGTHLMRRTCLSLNSDLPLRWRFYFYQSDNQWKLVDLRIDDGLVELFEDSARARK